MGGSWRVTGPVTEGGGRPQATRLALAPGDVFPRALDFSLGRPGRLDLSDFSSVPLAASVRQERCLERWAPRVGVSGQR